MNQYLMLHALPYVMRSLWLHDITAQLILLQSLISQLGGWVVIFYIIGRARNNNACNASDVLLMQTVVRFACSLRLDRIPLEPSLTIAAFSH
jgi:hypothetical protein